MLRLVLTDHEGKQRFRIVCPPMRIGCAKVTVGNLAIKPSLVAAVFFVLCPRDVFYISLFPEKFSILLKFA